MKTDLITKNRTVELAIKLAYLKMLRKGFVEEGYRFAIKTNPKHVEELYNFNVLRIVNEKPLKVVRMLSKVLEHNHYMQEVGVKKLAEVITSA